MGSPPLISSSVFQGHADNSLIYPPQAIPIRLQAKAPRQTRNLNYLDQFSMDSQLMSGRDNFIVDTLSRIVTETQAFRKATFTDLHGLSHPGTVKNFTTRETDIVLPMWNDS